MKVLLLFFVTCISLQAQTLSGTIRSDKGELMPFSTIWVNDLNKGTLANEEGKYAIQLPKGQHEVVFRFLGHTPKLHKISVSGDLSLDVVLSEESVTLKDINVGGLKETIHHQKTGLIVEKPVVSDIAESIQTYFDGNFKANFAAEIEKEKLENSWENFVAKIIAFSKEL
jgi:hypothetical protein